MTPDARGPGSACDRQTWYALLIVSSLGWSAAARADQLESALAQPLYEASHAVDVTVRHGVAIYKVRRVFANPGKVADEARLDIDLPYGGAATGLRIRAREQWFEGELMEAERAATLYQELTGKGIWKPKDPALLYWRWADKLALQVFPVMPGGTSTVEYTLTVPTRYSGGRVFLSYPRLSAEAAANLATPVFTLRPGWGDATTMVKVDGKRVSPDSPIVLSAPVEPAWLAAIEHDAAASYVASTIEIPESDAASRTFTTAKLTLDLEHTYKSDLRVSLYTPGGAELEVFGGDGGGSNDVRGTFDLKLPAKTSGVGMWRLVVSDHAALDAGSLESWTLQLGTGTAVKVASADTPVFIPDAPENASDGGTAMIELAPPEIDGIATRLGRVVASPAHAFGRLEIDAAPELRPLPRKAQVVFVIDASHSMAEAGVEAQLAIARAYLGHVGDAEVEVVLYRRAATRLFGGFIGAATFDARIKAARTAGKLAPGNGSALDEGAGTAAAALVGRKGPLRIVLVSDDLLRPRWDNALALAALKAAPAGTVVHLIDTDGRSHGGDPTLVRDDEHALAPIALAHHGILATLTSPERAGKDLPRLVLGLVRPVQIDHFAVKGFDLERGKYDEVLSDVLHEGAGVRLVVDAKNAPVKVEVVGMIWGDKFRRVVSADAAFSKAAAAWVFSEDDHDALSPAEMMTVAMMGKVVSPVTSYLATEPGVRPSTIGLERNSMGLGAGRGGMAPSVRLGSVGTKRIPPDPMKLVAAEARKCVDKHKPAAGWKARLTLESTYDEVVDVVIADGATLPVTSCLVEAVWAVRLTDEYKLSRETFTLAFS